MLTELRLAQAQHTELGLISSSEITYLVQDVLLKILVHAAANEVSEAFGAELWGEASQL